MRLKAMRRFQLGDAVYKPGDEFDCTSEPVIEKLATLRAAFPIEEYWRLRNERWSDKPEEDGEDE
jgi:hypothetical protein